MHLVHFPEELHARAPTVMGRLRSADNHKWVTPAEVVAAVNASEVVTIRPASEAELTRAEGYIALYDIGIQLAKHQGELLDADSPEQAEANIGTALEALVSVDVGLPNILGQGPVQEALAATVAEIGQLETADVLPELYAAMRRAYVAGDREAVFCLDNQIQTILLGSAIAEVAIERARSSAE